METFTFFESPYLNWAVGRPHVAYNLALSDVPACPPERLGLPGFAPALVNQPSGWPPLLDALAERYHVSRESIALAPGTTGANYLVMATLLQPGDHVIVERPTYDPLQYVPRSLGASVSFVDRLPEQRYAVDLAAIAAAITPATRLIIVSNLYNPACTRVTVETLHALATLAEVHDIHVLVDEVYLEWLRDDPLRPEGAPAAASLSPRLITTSSLTKAFGLSALHIGWIVATPDLVRRIHAGGLLAGVTPSHMSERLAFTALQNAEQIVTPLRELLARNRPVLKGWVEQTPGVTWCEPDAGATAFVSVGAVDSMALSDRLIAEFDTAIVPGEFFGAPGYIRVGYAVDGGVLAEGLARLGTALRSFA